VGDQVIFVPNVSFDTHVNMNIAIWISIMAGLFLDCKCGRNSGVPPNYDTKGSSRSVSQNNLVNPRIDPHDVNGRFKRSSPQSYSKRVVDTQDPGDIDIEIDTNQITVHTADHQLSINLLGKIFI
jgi:hypothetical protein